MSIDPRGKDLRWTPQSVLRDVRASWSAFRGSKIMFDTMDDTFMEAQKDDITLYFEALERGFERIVELLEEGKRIQAEKREPKAPEPKDD